jgi:divinyl chlorophyllide a 8-vinyl-reductase
MAEFNPLAVPRNFRHDGRAGVARGDVTDTIEKPGASRRRVLVLGATGTIGRATVRALVVRGDEVVCLVRRRVTAPAFDGAVVRFGDVTDPASVARDGIAGERFDAMISCLASRTGVATDAWAVDFEANLDALAAAKHAGIAHFVLLSAICVQKPRLAFQHAKLAFEAALMTSGLRWSIVRPTAYFKSLSGQVARVAKGKPYLMFGDGQVTACKPISDDDLGDFIAGCLDDRERWDRILPIGGPGAAITPLAQGEALFALLDRAPRYRRVPVALLDAIVALLGTLGRVVPALAAKAELARIGRYYATESMLVLDPATGRYDAAMTPSTGTATLVDHYAALLRGEATDDRGEHAVF